MRLRSFGGQPIFRRIFNRPSLLTKSKALVRSLKATYRGMFCSLNYSCSWQRENHVYRRSVYAEATLGLRVDAFGEFL